MNDKALSLIALLILTIGITVLWTIDFTTQPKVISISEAKDKTNSYVSITGKVIEVQDKTSFLILTLEDKTDNMQVLVYKDNTLNIEEEMNLLISGKVIEYKNQKEINADKIQLL